MALADIINEITDGTVTVSFAQVANISAARGGTPKVLLNADQLDGRLFGDAEAVAETWLVNIQSAGHDDLAAKYQALNRLMVKASEYRTTRRQTQVVWWKRQAATETQPRYAVCFGAYDFEAQMFLEVPFKAGDFANNQSITLLRETAWRSDPPGALPAAGALAQGLNQVLGPAAQLLSHISNGRETDVLSHIFTFQQSTTAPAWDTIITSSGASGNGTCAITVAANSNKVLFVLVFAVHGSVTPTCTVSSSVAGTCTLIKDFGAGVIAFSTFQLWQIVAPAAGAQTITATLGTNTGWAMATCSTYNVDQGIPDFALTWNNFTASPFSDTPHGGTYTLTLDGVVVNGAALPVLTVGGSQTSRANFQLGSQYYKMGVSTLAGAGNPAMSWTSTNVTKAVHFALSISPVLTFGTDHVSDTVFGLLPAASPVVGDGLIIMAANTLPRAAIFNTSVALVGTFNFEYSLAAGYMCLVPGSNVEQWPSGGVLTATGKGVVAVQPPSDAAAMTVNSLTGLVVKMSLATYTSGAPAQQTDKVYNANKNIVDIPALAIGGDTLPTLALRLWSDAGGVAWGAVGAGNTSRILIAAKSRGIPTFQTELNAGNAGNPSGWAVTYGTDAAALADPRASQGYNAHVTFSTDATNKTRVTWTGTAKLDDWKGTYRVYLRVRQNAGAIGDCSCRVRFRVGGSGNQYPMQDTPDVKTKAIDKTWEVLDLGLMTLPFNEPSSGDSTATVDIAFQVLAQRASGAATLDICDICLMPNDEWMVALQDPVTDPTYGASALRDDNVLELDGGLILDRCMKYVNISGVLKPGEEWLVEGIAPQLHWADETRLYFMLLYYPVSWGVGPMLAPLGMHLGVEVYKTDRTMVLRGAT